MVRGVATSANTTRGIESPQAAEGFPGSFACAHEKGPAARWCWATGPGGAGLGSVSSAFGAFGAE
jgi:hypothetical protein